MYVYQKAERNENTLDVYPTCPRRNTTDINNVFGRVERKERWYEKVLMKDCSGRLEKLLEDMEDVRI